MGGLAFCYLALAGLQAWHHHRDVRAANPDSCATCAIAQQAVRHAPAGAPALAVVFTSLATPAAPAAARLERAVSDASARAPPSAS